MNEKKECNKLGTAFMWLIQELCLFIFGGLFYYFIEILWRGHSHYSMMILGGLCYVIIGLINEVFPYDLKFEVQVIIGDIIVTILEFISGLILNVWLGLGIWDYSNVPFNIMGQICIPYMFLWLFLVAFAIISISKIQCNREKNKEGVIILPLIFLHHGSDLTDCCHSHFRFFFDLIGQEHILD